jgi:PAS domain S-box-containing protein
VNDVAVLALLQNAALLVSMSVAYEVATTRWAMRSGRFRPLVIGLLLGSIGMAIMLTPWELTSGVVFDTRSVLLGVAGLVFGAVPTGVAMAMTAALRLLQGGAGAGVGVAVILASGAIGIAWRRLRRGPLEETEVRELLLLGLLVHIVVLALMLALPEALAGRVLAAISLPMLVIHPAATAILGAFLVGRLRRERLGADLRASEERLRLALAAANQGLFDLDVPTGEVIVNDEYSRAFGYDPREARQTTATWIERVHPDDREQTADAYRECLAGRRSDFRTEFRLATKTGDWRWFLLLGEVVERDAEGSPRRLLGTLTDITARRETEDEARRMGEEASRLLEESVRSRRALLSVIEDLRASDRELRELAGGLERRVRDRTADLLEANRELEAFAYSVSHDLRAPQRAVAGFSQALTRRYADSLDDEGRHFLANVAAAADQMGRLIDDLLAYSRLGRRALRREPVPLAEIVARIHGTFESRLAESDARLEVEEPLVTPLGDTTLVEQILANLVGNALTYRREGVVPEITIGSTASDGTVTVSVADNGIGIAPEWHERIFELFARLHTDEEYEGTGIGLAISRKAARLMGGEITLESTPGSGSAFRLHLPASPEGASSGRPGQGLSGRLSQPAAPPSGGASDREAQRSAGAGRAYR